MADEKKPKIDLKARLGKNTMGQTPPPGAGMVPQAQPAPGAPPGMNPGMPVQGAPQSQRPAPMPAPGGGMQMPQVGVPIGPPTFKGPSRPPPGLDANNPLAAVAAKPYRAPAPAPIALPTRIEVDEVAVQQASKGGFKKGMVAGIVVAVVFGVVGYLGGGAAESSSGRKKSVQDAQELSKDVSASKERLTELANKLEAGRNSLTKDKKFPDTLAKDLGGMNIDFGGDKLQYRRFSGFSGEATNGLVEYITAVQSLNDRKSAVISLLTRLQKPITEQFKSAGAPTLQQVILLGRQDESRNYYAMIANLKDPIAINPGNISLPNEFTFIDPLTKQPSKVGKYTTGDLSKPGAIYVAPKTFDAVCPSETASQTLQLAGQIKHIIDDIRGEGGAGPAPNDPNGIVEDKKPGLVERADRLVGLLNKVGN